MLSVWLVLSVWLMLSVWLVRDGRLGVGTVVVFVVATRNLFESMLALSGSSPPSSGCVTVAP